ncbi:MAG TPA: hypothetical protein GX010_01910 [Erysipelotrichaceae bacterium]|nr:hypothetical protein [Erysipelotrichaceae bacterium]
MKILRAIGGFFVRIWRWIKETAWIQPLLIVGAIFAVIFSIPYIIDGVKGMFDESDAANKYFSKYQLSLKNADVIPDGKTIGTSEVDELFSCLDENNSDEVVASYGDRFFLAFVVKDSAPCKELYGGLKTFQEKWSSNNAEFSNLEGKFKLYTIYTDSVSKVDDETNLFDQVWLNHYSVFETLSSGYLKDTFYARNKDYNQSNYESAFVSDKLDSCPMSAPLVMYFDYTDDNLVTNQKVKGLSDIIFSVDGSSELDKARTLRDCWSHTGIFGEIKPTTN